MNNLLTGGQSCFLLPFSKLNTDNDIWKNQSWISPYIHIGRYDTEASMYVLKVIINDSFTAIVICRNGSSSMGLRLFFIVS